MYLPVPYQAYRSNSLRWFFEVNDVFISVFVKLDLLYFSKMRDSGFRRDPIDRNVLQLWDHAAMNADLVPAVFTYEGVYKSLFLRGHYDCINVRRVKRGLRWPIGTSLWPQLLEEWLKVVEPLSCARFMPIQGNDLDWKLESTYQYRFKFICDLIDDDEGTEGVIP